MYSATRLRTVGFSSIWLLACVQLSVFNACRSTQIATIARYASNDAIATNAIANGRLRTFPSVMPLVSHTAAPPTRARTRVRRWGAHADVFVMRAALGSGEGHRFA